MRKIKLTHQGLPVPRSLEWQRLWAQAAERWPGIQLTLIGRDLAGNFYFQQWGNPVPFVLEQER